MREQDIAFRSYVDGDFENVFRLSQGVRWPHRREDLSLVLRFSDGVVIEHDGTLVGSAFCVSIGRDAAAFSMIIVDEPWRGRGLGRRLVAACVDLAGARQTHLLATQDGIELYKTFGFEARGEVAQHQGVVLPGTPDGSKLGRVRWAGSDDLDQILQMDRSATGLDRSEIVRELDRVGRFAIWRSEQGKVEGLAGLRAFGRGHVIGPVIATRDGPARDLISFFLAERQGEFCRIDTDVSFGLGEWLEGRGLGRVDTVLPMFRNAGPDRTDDSYKTFTLINHAFG